MEIEAFCFWGEARLFDEQEPEKQKTAISSLNSGAVCQT